MIVSAVLTVAGLGLVMGVGLVLASKYLAVEVDPRVEQVAEELPNANCGACGYAGCTGFAKAVVEGEANPADCTPGGKETAERIAAILGVEAGEIAEKIAVILCAGHHQVAEQKSNYFGVQECRAAALVNNGDKLCPYGCLGLGSCQIACPFGAVIITKDNIAVIDPDKCTGCGKCIDVCPRNIIKLAPKSREVHVLCSSRDKGKIVKGYCKVGCIACKLCTRESKAFNTKSGLSIVDDSFEGEISKSAALVCAPQSIVDTRDFRLVDYISRPDIKESFKVVQEEYKEEQKRLKAAKKAAKAKKDAEKAEKKNKTDKSSSEEERKNE